MAFQFPALQMPRFWPRKAAAIEDTIPGAPQRAGRLAMLKGLSANSLLAILIGLLIACLAVDALLVHMESTQSTYATTYIARAGKLRTLSQRLAKAALQATFGNVAALKQLRESRDEFSETVKLLSDGGPAGDVNLPPTSSFARGALDKLVQEWSKTEKSATVVVNETQTLLGLGAAVRNINGRNSTLSDLAEELAALTVVSAPSTRHSIVAGEIMVLTQRIAKNANIMLGGDTIDPEVAFLLSKDTNTFRDNLQSLINGKENPRTALITNPEAKAKLAELETAFKEYLRSITEILGNSQAQVKAKQAARDVFLASDSLLAASDVLVATYEDEQRQRSGYIWLVLVSALAFVALVLAISVYVADSRRRVAASERLNVGTQDAILRLLNEMGELAEGNLTVRAKVTEDITGAIADSVNATIDELRRLVTGIMTAANQVTAATGEAQKITGQLQQAAKQQSGEIRDTSRAVTSITESIQEVSANAAKSARVADDSLAAANKGAMAVQNAIHGMNDIREQIQETAKRIKRLGESSQEIGEIVQLISDITEQTNVLALNAAIQAASAGEAGRGFTVVAEEVQRLAERSAEATKHISAIVRSIQSDTQDTVVAMERSTQGVVEGTKIADSAGKALEEIGTVSRQLATLIASISNATTSQAEAAAQVSARMQDILGIT
ncbi:MAG TPA: methyl-accepting chemotaxis protein, partial [Burkholderiales bacterium]|nr:methyl-accepting chemotaxis protein [Burkholderiales bacterium]